MYALLLILLLLVLLLLVLLFLYSRQLRRQKWQDETDECRFFNQVYGKDPKEPPPQS
ncbi:hypothetical protein [Neisseria shayeganii]|uniref:Uncharacterized protein n=1 Tax=Neisseria shayeganii TaxID=607712 RepID=A0A7D7S479_9NEIS|nr:hypothetical protein [Neisseria shayeganii]QMT39726.1 hypothetical protein H3L94_07545 [Neisseria shayeganii]